MQFTLYPVLCQPDRSMFKLLPLKYVHNAFAWLLFSCLLPFLEYKAEMARETSHQQLEKSTAVTDAKPEGIIPADNW